MSATPSSAESSIIPAASVGVLSGRCNPAGTLAPRSVVRTGLPLSGSPSTHQREGLVGVRESLGDNVFADALAHDLWQRTCMV